METNQRWRIGIDHEDDDREIRQDYYFFGQYDEAFNAALFYTQNVDVFVISITDMQENLDVCYWSRNPKTKLWSYTQELERYKFEVDLPDDLESPSPYYIAKLGNMYVVGSNQDRAIFRTYHHMRARAVLKALENLWMHHASDEDKEKYSEAPQRRELQYSKDIGTE